MASEANKILEMIGVASASIALCVGIAVIPTCMWFCFDDTLADILGNPKVGDVGFGTVFAFSTFLTMTLKGTATIKRSK